MTAMTISCQPAPPHTAPRSGAPALPCAGPCDDLYAHWTSVFERAQATQPRPDRTDAAVAGAPAGPCGEAGDRAPSGPAPRVVVATPPAAPVSDAAWARPLGRPGRLEQAEAAACGPPGPQARAPSPAVTHKGSQPPDRWRAADPTGCVAGASAPGFPAMAARCRRTGRTTSTPSQPISPESVSVFTRGTKVAVVVRDAALTDREAMHCALEAAYQLTGQRGSLHLLTVNGRTLYRPPGPAGTLPRAASAALAFAC